ncbi:MAG: pantoate--beta-alanine ligase [Deltaproteobacteria bacterium]|nr:pantoate--beta-alanine ligase [Deltaproteobacteria bacterium]
MKIIRTTAEMQAFSNAQREAQKHIAFVPTMGYFHDGHLELMRAGKRCADILVISIFVNPTQFSPNEDLQAYPRDFDRDCTLAQEVGVDVVFAPENDAMYPNGFQTFVAVEKLTQNLCGRYRPQHFRGVTTVCAKLFNIIKPHTVIFGKKDYQQLAAISRMLTDLNMDIELVGMPIVREANGLAMSSRNTYLNATERKSALALSHSLREARSFFLRGENNAQECIMLVRSIIDGYSHTAIDYIQICETKNFTDIATITQGSLLALAVKVGKTRLIDNYVFGEELNLP